MFKCWAVRRCSQVALERIARHLVKCRFALAFSYLLYLPYRLWLWPSGVHVSYLLKKWTYNAIWILKTLLFTLLKMVVRGKFKKLCLLTCVAMWVVGSEGAFVSFVFLVRGSHLARSCHSSPDSLLWRVYRSLGIMSQFFMTEPFLERLQLRCFQDAFRNVLGNRSGWQETVEL